MKCLHLSNNDINGGAQIATYRIHKSLKLHKLKSKILVRNKFSKDMDVIVKEKKFSQKLFKLKLKLSSIIKRLQGSQLNSFHSNNILPSNLSKYINNINFDIVNLHWIGEETISIKDISNIKAPKVFTLHDMWGFCGGEHYIDEKNNMSWHEGYKKNHFNFNNFYDLNFNTWKRKKKFWQPMDIVCPSKWLYELAKKSNLMHNWNVHHVPYPIDNKIYCKKNKDKSKSENNIPKDSIIIMFGAIQANSDKRKGFDLLVNSLNKLKTKKKIIGVVFGNNEIKIESTNIELIYKNHIKDENKIISLYNAADIMTVPSRQDNLPLVAMEAASCSLPIVAFDVGGLKDIVIHNHNGFLAKPFDTSEFAYYLDKLIDSIELRNQMSDNAIRHIKNSFSLEEVGKKYIEIYKNLMDKSINLND